MRGWTLEDSEIDPLELTPELRDFARAMAGESAVDLTSDRSEILASAATEVEFYCSRLFFRGVGGAARVCTSVLEVDEAGDVPIVGAATKSVGITIVSVEQWDDEGEDFEPAPYIRRPHGEIRLPDGGAWRVTASVLPALTYPVVVNEATARLFSYREAYKPRKQSSDISDGAAPSIAGAMLRSGSAECLRYVRTPGV